MRGPCAGNEWFTIESNKTGTRWTGKVWYFHDRLKYEYDLEFDLPVTYPNVAPELALPELDGKTEKMYRGGKICLDGHFRPLWARNVPRFGIAHAMALGVRAATRRHALRTLPSHIYLSHNGVVLRLQMGPWLAVEIPALVAAGRCARAKEPPAPAQPLLTRACPAGSHTRTRRRLREISLLPAVRRRLRK